MSDRPPMVRTALLDATLQAGTKIERVKVARVELAPANRQGFTGTRARSSAG